jgi:hypothetical protein
MWRPGWIRSVRPSMAEKPARPASRRDRLAVQLAVVTFVCVGLVFFLSKGTLVLMPGPLASAHGGIEKCSACHTKSGSGKLSWTQGLVAGNPHADSRACLTCHKMPDTAFNAHGASAEVLKKSTERLAKIAAGTPAPQSASAQGIAFPAHDVAEGGLTCATCHQEHQGVNFKLGKISNEQCRSCHVVKFDSFDGNHPAFENFPFKQRTQIIYDHAGHFGKHYPELAKKDPAKRIPDTCSTCHNSRDDKRIMAVAPFDKTCSTCHLDQITGKERASGPKGIAFLTVPSLDLQSLKKKNAATGEWPDASEAALTPFMKVMISRDERGRALLKTVDSLNLQDLTNASDDQIKAVTSLVWEIKGLFHALISGKASDVLADLNMGSGAKLSASIVADLTANIPRDVLISAQQEWLPNLATEMANRKVTSDQVNNGWSTVTTDSNLAGPAPPKSLSATDQRQAVPSVSPQPDGRAAPPEGVAAQTDTPEPPEEVSDTDERQEATSDSPKTEDREAASAAKLDPQACMVRVLGQCLMLKGQKNDAEAARPDGAAGQTNAANPKPGSGKETFSAGEFPPAMRAGIKFAENAAQPGEEAGTAEPSKHLPLPSGTPREIEARSKDAGKAADPEGAAGKADSPEAKPDSGKETPAADDSSSAIKAGRKDAKTAVQSEGAGGKTDAANAKPDDATATPPASAQPQGKAADQSDELLFPTEAELREMKVLIKDADKSAQPDAAAGKTDPADAVSKPDANTAAAEPPASAAPVISIESNVDPESWADYGGWYRQDYAIFYRPTGHKDKFVYSWLFLTGPQAPKGDTSPAAAVFDGLTSKDAQGSCTKCHSIDNIQGKGRVVNFSPPSVASKQGRFTSFIHEPHFGSLGDRGCLTCHSLEKGRPGAVAVKTDTANAKHDDAVSADAASKENAAAPAGAPAVSTDAEKGVSPYLKSYEQGHPHNFASEFSAVKKDLCQSCHNSSMARQDCLTCHKYHVNDVISPIMSTKNPIQ